ncbi:hypothetical protein VaNZ11_002869 [Volvox africanus]|uniref:Uncharacterized protein n=1 Tax=Volvox africanus TaxID=51714 RepID=A0ABQ5RTN4_9CHLO|nr:hypothetical protein VaNZ11_002869 [Volvox africanus]
MVMGVSLSGDRTTAFRKQGQENVVWPQDTEAYHQPYIPLLLGKEWQREQRQLPQMEKKSSKGTSSQGPATEPTTPTEISYQAGAASNRSSRGSIGWEAGSRRHNSDCMFHKDHRVIWVNQFNQSINQPTSYEHVYLWCVRHRACIILGAVPHHN